MDGARAACDNRRVTETPEQRVARLEAELAQAKVEALQKQLAQAQSQAGGPPRTFRFTKAGEDWFRKTPSAVREPVDTRLASAPRRVPIGYRLIAIPFSMWSIFALFMVAVSPIALWIFVPVSAVVAAIITSAVILALLLRKSLLRNALLKWGEVADVTGTELLSRGTYYSGTTVQNVRMAQAHGWRVERRWYSGPVSKTRVSYQLHGTRADLVIRGLEYDGGVILADTRDPRRALCVSSFPYDLGRDADGNWTGTIPARTKVGSVLMALVLLGWTVAMCVLWGMSAADLPGIVRH